MSPAYHNEHKATTTKKVTKHAQNLNQIKF